MTIDRGYIMGPIIPPDESPWPILWEREVAILDKCIHVWELCLLAADGRARVRIEEVVRCVFCHVPRCGHSTEEDPCMRRRHHRTDHRYLRGGVRKVGA